MKRFVGASVVVLGLILIACGDDPAPASSSNSASTNSDSENGNSSQSTTSTTTAAPLSSPKKGQATFYDADGSGNCSFDATPNDLDVTAMQLPEYDGSNACGTCLLVTGPKASVTVRVVDSCPGCADKNVDLDLSAQAFAKIADPSAGKIDISFAPVPCAVTGPIAYHFKDGSSKYWTAIQVRNAKLPIAKLEYMKSGSWVAIDRVDYNYFVVNGGVGDQPNGLQLRVTSSDGKTLTDTLPGTIPSDKTESGAAQFN